VSEFIEVARIGDIPEGEIRPFKVGRHDVAVANVDGVLYAICDICSHAYCALSDGDLEGTEVVCPCHGSTFDLRTGHPLSPPAVDPVARYDVVVDGDVVKVAREPLTD
jgi:3-phenylpropionate/trans-cinnamate dioxygenase ferredoxin subunit